MQHAARARGCVVHPRGARHLIDPTHLIRQRDAPSTARRRSSARTATRRAGRRRARASTTHDGMTLELAGRPLQLPRHARPRDAPPLHLGRGEPRLLHRRHLRPVVPRVRHRAPAPGSCRRRRRCSSSPRPCAARSSACSRSIRTCMYVTHYGRVGDVPRLAALLLGAARRDGRARGASTSRGPASPCAR